MNKTKNFFALLLISAAPLLAVETAFWQVGTYEEFFQGSLRDVSLTREGRLGLAPEARVIFNPEETLALSLATDKNRNIFIGTGHQGKVFKVDSSGKGSLFFTAREPEIFALAAASDGILFVGSSPEGKIYRVDADGKSTVFYEPKTKYIWALTLDGKGNLYAGTGDQGKIYKIDPSGKGEIFFDSKQTHIMCLTLDRAGNLLAGSVPNGLVYRIDAQGKGFVLYQASYPEIHDIALDPEGRIYAAALGGAGGKATPDLFPGATPASPAPGTVTTVTVTAATEGVASEAKEAQAPGQAQGATSTVRPAPQTAPFPGGQIPQGRGSLIVIRPDQSVETLWSSTSESVFGLAVRGEGVYFSTDSNGRIFELVPTEGGQRLTLLAQTRESLATRLLLQGSDLYVATSNIAKLFQVTASPAKEGTYESPVKDTKFVSRWGNLAWRADMPAGASLEFFSRSGNSDRPDHTWSDWAGPYKNPEGSAIQSPAARFLQWKATFRSSAGKGPDLNEVTVSYLNQNLPPQVRSVSVNTAGERTGPTGSSSGSSGGAISVTVTPSGGSSGATTGKTGTVLSWQADDPNGDQLTYSVYVQATDEQEWHLLKDKLRQTNYPIDPNSLADGKYVARVVASDEESNPPETARTGELLSAPFWVDNTPPAVTVARTEVSDSGVQVQFQVQDTTSPLRHAEVLLDAMEWRDIASDDGIVDARQETFTVKLGKLEAGEHIVTLRAFDAAGNAGVGKAVVRVPAGPGGSR
jgi:hypothetical protein